MSKQESYSRYNLIIKKLKNPASFSEIKDYLNFEGELEERNYNISKRTFQRDVKAIFGLFKIEITYDKSLKKYKATSPNNEIVKNRMLEAFDTFNALNISERIGNHIIFENRKSQGTDNFNLFLHAIKNYQYLKVVHHKFGEESPTQRKLAPYAVKECKSRWYLVARDNKDGVIKTFGFDRIVGVDLLKEKFPKIEEDDIQEKFKHFFGVITPDGENPVEIILQFNSFQGKYIETLPLHHSQKVITKEENIVQIALLLVPTYDFIIELMSMGSTVKILQPKSLQQKIKKIALEIAAKY